MDKVLERKQSDKLKSQLARNLKQYGFKRTKPTFYTRIKEDRIEFIHIHKFTFGPEFRVHIGARFYCDSFDAIALNGIDSDGFRNKYSFSYNEDEESVEKCVNEMMKFILKEGFEWFDYWLNPIRLINETSSPINRIKSEYLKFQKDRSLEEEQFSRKLLGINNVMYADRRRVDFT